MKKERKETKEYKLRIKTFTLKVRERIEGEIIKEPEQSHAIIKSILDKLDAGQEHFIVLYLDIKGRVQYFKVLASGGSNDATIDPKLIFKTALLTDASSLIISHNHPSGDITPSEGDNRVTKRLKEAGELLGISLIDHLIVSEQNDDFFSYNEERLLL